MQTYEISIDFFIVCLTIDVDRDVVIANCWWLSMKSTKCVALYVSLWLFMMGGFASMDCSLPPQEDDKIDSSNAISFCLCCRFHGESVNNS